MSCSCSSCARRRDESLLRGKGAIEWSRRESTTRRYRDEHRTARARVLVRILFTNARSLFYPRYPRHDSTSASSHDPPFIFDDRLRFLRLVCVLSRHPPVCSLRFTSRSATSNEPKYARIPSRRPGDGTRDEARAREPARVREARGCPAPSRFSLFVSFRLFETRGGEKPSAPRRARRRAGRRARAETRARALIAYRHHARAPLSSTRPRIAAP